jgi:hypothetical protein
MFEAHFVQTHTPHASLVVFFSNFVILTKFELPLELMILSTLNSKYIPLFLLKEALAATIPRQKNPFLSNTPFLIFENSAQTFKGHDYCLLVSSSCNHLEALLSTLTQL